MQFIRSQVPHESGPVPQARPVLGSAVCRCWTVLVTGLDPVCSWWSTVLTTRRGGFDSRKQPSAVLAPPLWWGRKPHRPGTPERGAGQGPAERHRASAGGLRIARSARNRMQPSTQKEAMAQPKKAVPSHRPVDRCVA